MTDINRKAPVQAQAQHVSSARRDEVYGVLTDLTRWSSVYPELRELEVEGAGPTEVGTKFRFKSGPMQLEAELTALEEGRLLAFQASGRGASSQYVFRLEDVAEGTHIEVEQSMEGLAVKTMKPMLQKIADTSLVDWVRAIGQAAEAS